MNWRPRKIAAAAIGWPSALGVLLTRFNDDEGIWPEGLQCCSDLPAHPRHREFVLGLGCDVNDYPGACEAQRHSLDYLAEHEAVEGC